MFTQYNRHHVGKQVKISAGILAIALSAILLHGCENQPLATAPGTTKQLFTVRDVAYNNSLLGKTVTVKSKPVGKVGNTSFTLSNNQLFGEPMLVVNATGKPVALPDDASEVRVTGTLTKFVLSDVERNFDLELDAKSYQGYDGKPVIIAQSISVPPQGANNNQ